MIKNNLNQNFKPYLGNYKPLNIYKGNTKIAGYTNQELTGSSLHLENCYNQNFNGEIYGNSSRATREGYNCYVNAERLYYGSCSVAGGAEQLAEYDGYTNVVHITQLGGWATLANNNLNSYYTNNVSAGSTIVGMWLIKNPTNCGVSVYVSSSTERGYTGLTKYKDVDENWAYYYASYKFKSTATNFSLLPHFSTTGEIYVAKMQVTVGSEVRDFEQYGAMPSPGFPSEIENVTSIPIVRRNKNYIQNELTTRVINNVTITKFDDGSFKLNGTASAWSSVNLFDNKDINLDSGSYVLSSSHSGTVSGGNCYFCIYDNSNTQISANYINTERSKVFNLSSNATLKKCLIMYGAGTVFDNLTIYPMLEKGTTATNYIKYKPQLNLTLTPQQPMCSIGDIKDCFIRVDGVWKERHRVGTKILNGTENWEAQWTGIRYSYRTNIENMKLITSTTILSNILTNYFKNYNQEDLYALQTGSNGICQRANQKQVIVRYDSKTTINDFKNWLTTNITTVMYELETPTDLICNAEQVAVLNQLAYYPKDCVLEFDGVEAKVIYAEMEV